jgi:hypothetical protein
MAQPKGNNLESLLMAYTDLSGSGRGSSFKGPPLKEVKIEKAAAPAFKPSAKARDWSSLEQALEAFVVAPPGSQGPMVQPDPGFSGFAQWQTPDATPAPSQNAPARQGPILRSYISAVKIFHPLYGKN